MTKPDRATILEIAVKASVDPRSAEKALRGGEVRGLAGSRLRRVLRETGLGESEQGARSDGR